MKKILAIFLALCMTFPLLTACAEDTAEQNETDTPAAESVETQPEEPEDPLAHIGEHNFNGENFTVLCREIQDTDTFNEVAVDEVSADVVDDAVYKRNQMLSERYNVNIVAHRVNGNWPSRDNFMSTLKTSVTAADSIFDLVLGYQAYMSYTDMAQYMYDFNKLSGLNLDAEYYYSDIIEESTINNKLYYLTGDFTYSIWPSLLVYFFNKDMAAAYSLEDMYDLVRSGKWTSDKMIELTNTVYRDLNGNTIVDEEDEFGLATDHGNVADAYYAAFDIEIASRDENGKLVFNENLEHFDNVVSKLYDFYETSNSVYTFTMMSNMTDNPLLNIFVDNRALFYPERLKNAIDFRGLEMDFGILPYPKWNEQQDNYYSQAWNGYSVMVIPIDAPNLEKTTVMIEALNAASQQTVIPAFYEKAIKAKYARDEESAEMLDIIRGGITFQSGYFFVDILGSATPIRIRDLLATGDRPTTILARLKKPLKVAINTIMQFYFN